MSKETSGRTKVAGPVAVEGDPTGDGRMMEVNSLTWDDVLPFPIVFDILEGDHTAPVVGAIESLERRDGRVVWGEGYLSDSEVPEVQAYVNRARELLEEGAVGVSVRLDSEVVELRVKKELVAELPDEGPEQETDASGDRVIVAKFSADDVLYVTTSARVRHLAIVDTAAIVTSGGNRFGIAASGALSLTGAVSASALAGDWDGLKWMFENPKFGDIHEDRRLRYDPERDLWSCPPTVEDSGRCYGHVTPTGICLRGRPDKCVNPPEGDLEGYMRGRAPAAGGLRTGVICVAGGHCRTGIGALEATQFYDNTGRAIADVRVGRDRYGIWYSGMIRPGASKDDVYTFEAGDISGHWEYAPSGRMTLVGLPAVNVGGFPKGYLTYSEYRGGLAASAGLSVEEGCTSWDALSTPNGAVELPEIMRVLGHISTAVGELYAAHLRTEQ